MINNIQFCVFFRNYPPDGEFLHLPSRFWTTLKPPSHWVTGKIVSRLENLSNVGGVPSGEISMGRGYAPSEFCRGWSRWPQRRGSFIRSVWRSDKVCRADPTLVTALRRSSLQWFYLNFDRKFGCKMLRKWHRWGGNLLGGNFAPRKCISQHFLNLTRQWITQ